MALRPPDQVSIDNLSSASSRFLHLLEEALPAAFDLDSEDWERLSLPLLIRLVTMFDSCVQLASLGRMGDSYMVFRSLYEHSVNYYWLAIDPEAHVPLWTQHSKRYHRTMDEEMRSFGYPVLSDDLRDEYEGLPYLKELKQRAMAADKHWSRELPNGFRPFAPDGNELLTMSGQYSAIYRTGSRLVHAEPWSMDEFIQFSGKTVTVNLNKAKKWDNRMTIGVAWVTNAFAVHRFDHGWPALGAPEAIAHDVYFEDESYPGPTAQAPEHEPKQAK